MITLCKNVLRFVQILKCVSFALRKIVFTWIIEDWSGSVQVSPCCPVVQTEKKKTSIPVEKQRLLGKSVTRQKTEETVTATRHKVSCLRI